jgi:hypothetical protein
VLLRLSFVVLFAGLLGTSAALAQTSGGVFRGEIRDASGAVITQAKISIRSSDNGTESISESNDDGLYLTPTLIPGSYLLTATKLGFKAEVFGPVTLQVNKIVRVDFVLDLGAASDSIQVLATAVQLVSLESAEVSQVIAI